MSEIENELTAKLNAEALLDERDEAKPKAKSSKRKSKTQSSEAEILEKVSWAAGDLEFANIDAESGENPQPMSLEELARRVAETVANNESKSLMLAEDTEVLEAVLAAETSNETAEIFVEALEISQENTDLSQDAELASNDLPSMDQEPVEFIEQDQLLSIIESMLFSTNKPVSVATIRQLFKGSNVRTKDITRALETLASQYASPVRGVTLEDINGGFQLRTKTENTEFLRRLTKVKPFRLSGPALEVMAIVAYKQPITKHEIDEIRGVESSHLLRALMERGLVTFEGKSDLPGKPMTYGSTRKFLETFGLRNIRELPTLSEIDELIPDGIGEVEEKDSLSDLTDRMSQTVTSSYSEGEEELLKIGEQLKAVDTTSEFFQQEKIRERERRDHERAQDIREKMVLGDAVEDKDRKWLKRYDDKLLAASRPPAEKPPSIAGDLEALQAESTEADMRDEDADNIEDEVANEESSDIADAYDDSLENEIDPDNDAEFNADNDVEKDGENEADQ